MNRLLPLALAVVILTSAASAQAACVNKYVHRKDGKMKIALTVVTGTLTFAEAQQLAADVAANKAEINWTDKNGKTILGALPGASAVRPMPVACGDKSSGSVLSVSFLRPTPPSGTIYLKLGSSEPVAFEEQKN